MQIINEEEANSDTRPNVDGAVEQHNQHFSGESLDKIIEAGRLLTVDERAKLRRVLGKFCSKRIKKIIREKLAVPTIPWGNPNAYKQILFLDSGEIRFIASQNYRNELSVCRKELIGPL